MRGSWEEAKKKVRGGVGASQRGGVCANWKLGQRLFHNNGLPSKKAPRISQGSRLSIQCPLGCPANGSKVIGPRKLSIQTNA